MFFSESRMESVRPGQKTSSLSVCVSVGMQRVSSLRTQRVAESSVEREAHSAEHDWQLKESPSPPIAGPKEGGGMYDCTDVPQRKADRGAEQANGKRWVGGEDREAKRGAVVMQCDL